MNLSEFDLRSKRLGKLKNHRKEYTLLEEILRNPYPMIFSKEPMNKIPDYYGWVYFNLEYLQPNEPLHPKQLFTSVALVHKVITSAYEIVHNRKRIYSNGYAEYVIAKRILKGEEGIQIEIGKPSPIKIENPKELTYRQVRTILHLIRFRETDFNGNFWKNQLP